MELTNHSFLETRRDYLYASNARKLASDRLSSGDRLSASKHDLGAIGVSAKLNTHRIKKFAEKTNLQNFHTYLDSQLDGLNQAKRIYDRMSVLATKALDPALADNGTDLKSLNQEFQELSVELDKIVDAKVNGQRLYGGRSVDFTEGISDKHITEGNTTPLTPKYTSVDVGTTSGSMTIKFSTGSAPDQVYLFRGKLPDELQEYFEPETYYSDTSDPSSLKPNSNGARDKIIELQGKLDNHFDTHGLFTTGSWSTRSSAKPINEDLPPGHADRNFDTFIVNFDDCMTKVKTEYDSGNTGPGGNSHSESDELGEAQYNDLKNGFEDWGDTTPPTKPITNGLLRESVAELSKVDDPNFLTMVGLNYNKNLTGPGSVNDAIYEVKAEFNPSLPANDLVMPSTNSTMPGISFGSLGCGDITTKENAMSVLSSVSAELENLTDSFAAVAALQSRAIKQTKHLNASEVTYEAATSRVNDTDFAKEATDLARNYLKEELAVQMMSKSARLKDVLIPLTTNHFRSHFLKSTL